MLCVHTGGEGGKGIRTKRTGDNGIAAKGRRTDTKLGADEIALAQKKGKRDPSLRSG
jgi:hypothetical protein